MAQWRRCSVTGQAMNRRGKSMLRCCGGWLGLILGVAACAAAAAPAADEDHRAWQHGVNLLRVGGKLLLVWGSAGNPPRANPGADWQHDVYYAWLDPLATADAAALTPQVLVSRPEAQEPPSVAINASGVILMTSEDGNGGINQQAGLWDSALRVRRPYPFLIRRGGHSGHAAAMGERFLVTYGEGWVDGGGWRGLGTGEKVFARSVDGEGKLGREIRLTPEHIADPRDGWPLVAGSESNWLVVWQRYPQLSLQAALIDAAGTVVMRRQLMDGLPLRYSYDVQFAPPLAAYVVAGSSGDGGFVALLGVDGAVIRTRRGLPPMASESRIVLGQDGARQIGVYPVSPRGIAVVRLSADAIELVKLIDHATVWDYTGTSGTFVAPGRVLFATLSRSGVRIIPVDLRLRGGTSTESR